MACSFAYESLPPRSQHQRLSTLDWDRFLLGKGLQEPQIGRSRRARKAR